MPSKKALMATVVIGAIVIIIGFVFQYIGKNYNWGLNAFLGVLWLINLVMLITAKDEDQKPKDDII